MKKLTLFSLFVLLIVSTAFSQKVLSEDPIYITGDKLYLNTSVDKIYFENTPLSNTITNIIHSHGVSSLNEIQGDVVLVEGSNIEISTNENEITINAANSLQIQADWTESDDTKSSYIQNKPELSTVATSGNYNDLTNKPNIPVVPTNVSDFNNDAGYITSSAIPTNYVPTTGGTFSGDVEFTARPTYSNTGLATTSEVNTVSVNVSNIETKISNWTTNEWIFTLSDGTLVTNYVVIFLPPQTE